MSSEVALGAAHAPFVVSLDIGSSSVRALVCDRLGQSLIGFHARRPHTIRTTTEGSAELDADNVFDLVCQCLDDMYALIEAHRLPLAGVTCCTLVATVLGVDRSYQPCTPVYTYADRRAGPDAAWLRETCDQESVHQRTGCPFHSSYLPARLCWLKRTNPTRFNQVAHWLSLGEYVEWRLFGVTTVSYSVASWSGLFDRDACEWDAPLLALIGVDPSKLSPINHTAEPYQGMTAYFAARWPLLNEVPWFPAVADGAAMNVGTGCVSRAELALTIGTSSAVRVLVEDPVPHIPKGLWCYRIDRQRSLVGGALSEGGNVLDWILQTMKTEGYRTIEDALAAVKPDGHGLTVLPFLSGERSPGWADDARACLYGLTIATTPKDIVRAFLEAIAYRIAIVVKILEGVLHSEFRVIASGGALTRSPEWLSMMAHVLNRPVTVSEVSEPSARGAALLALEHQGLLTHVREVPAWWGKTFFPDQTLHNTYCEAQHRHEEMYKRLIET